jgi:hypothetical protein
MASVMGNGLLARLLQSAAAQQSPAQAPLVQSSMPGPVGLLQQLSPMAAVSELAKQKNQIDAKMKV